MIKYIAALGEVQESLGSTVTKQKYMQSFKLEYPRRINFIRDLASLGMKK